MLFDFLKKRKKYNLNYFATALVWHCNLNCKYCDHFSPIAETKFIEPKVIKKHFLQLRKVIDIKTIGLMGGEPLLHPQLKTILKMSRKIFPHTNLLIFTNGILLNNQDDEFWEICRQYKIHILISKLDIKINFYKSFTKAKLYGVTLAYYGAEAGKYKKMYKMKLDEEGRQDVNEMHKICWQNKGSCNYFEDGKLYKCSIAGNVFHFNKYFKKNLQVTPKDYIDVYKVKNIKEIEDYFNNPMPFCRYCNFKENQYDLDFEISKREITEWI